ncbi:MAG: hypothetical protein ACI9NQ_000616 [Paracoccaceae bacterium]|jgi:uncharacterized protein YlxW (UPF0749 family)
MNNQVTSFLLVLNLIGITVLGAFLNLQYQKQQDSHIPVAPESSTTLELSSLAQPLANITSEIEKLNATVQRFSTSSVQYDFLKREMDHLAVVDQTIGVQTQATVASKTEKNAEQVDEAIGKLSNLSQHVKSQLQTRRKTMLQLISGLEKELAEISSPPSEKKAPVQTPAIEQASE